MMQSAMQSGFDFRLALIQKVLFMGSYTVYIIQCWTRVHTLFHQSFDIALLGGGGGGKATQFKTDNSAFLKLRFENTKN